MRHATSDELERAIKAHGPNGAARALRRYGLIAPIAGAAPIAVDSSTVAASQTTTLTGSTVTLTPPAQSLVVIGIGCAAMNLNQNPFTGHVSDGTNNYTLLTSTFRVADVGAALYCHYYTTSPGSITITPTLTSGSVPSQGVDLVPVVLTGAASTQNGGVATPLSASGSTASVTVPATAAGSMCIAMEANFTSGTAPTKSGDQSTTFNGHNSFYTTSGNGFWAQYEPTLTSGAGNVTISDTAPTGLTIAMVGVEILAAAGGGGGGGITVMQQALMTMGVGS